MNLILLILTSSACIFGIEILKRKFQLPTDITRRATHISTAMVAGLAPLFVTKNELTIVCIIFAVVLLYGHRWNIFTAIHSVERKTFGEVCLPLGVAVTALFFLPQNLHAFQFGIFIMGVSDAIGGLVGERFGKHTFILFGNKKTLEGSITFFLCSLILTFLFFPIFGYKLLLIPLILTATEFGLIYGLDNLVLPILSAYLIHFFV